MDTIEAMIHDMHVRLALPLPQHDVHALNQAFAEGPAAFVRAMQLHTKLTCVLTLGKVRAGGPERSAAWVELPPNVPLYGTRSFDARVFTIFVRNEVFERHNLRALAYVVAHEFSHILLHAVRSPYCESEVATDLCAMLLGYDHLMAQGMRYTVEKVRVSAKPWWQPPLFTNLVRDVTQETFRVGYLTDEELRTATRYIAHLRTRA